MRHAKEENNSGDSFGLRDTLVWCGIPIIIVLLIRIFLLGFYVISLRVHDEHHRTR